VLAPPPAAGDLAPAAGVSGGDNEE